MMALNARLCRHLVAGRTSSLAHNKLCLHRRLSRLIHVSSSQREAVKLSYNVHQGNPSNQPVVILHGLLGSGKNFDGIAKQLVRLTGREVLTVDARNHGDSEHSDKMEYEDMALDIVNMLSEIKAKSCTLIGHSLGGRTAMTLALTKPELVDKLAVIDVSPVHHGRNMEILNFLLGMQNVEMPEGMNIAEARKHVGDQLLSVIPAEGVFAKVTIPAGEFLMQYQGELISRAEGEKREISTKSVFRINATTEPPDDLNTARLGRLVNHGEPDEVNAKVKVVAFESSNPTLCLFSVKTIEAGQEVLYDYGIKDLPWKTRDQSMRDFILTNVVERNGQIMWRVNVDVMLKYFRELGRIPKDKPPFVQGPTLFIAGSLSDYITEKDHPHIYRHFPKAEIKTIQGASHWVHYDKPQELIRLLAHFINGQQ